jgi:hypothetical protein
MVDQDHACLADLTAVGQDHAEAHCLHNVVLQRASSAALL